MLISLDSLRLPALCACLPTQSVANEAKLAQTTGIVSRRIARPGATVVDLCVRAAERALADANAKPSDFGAIVFVSFTQPCRMPSGAAQVQARLGFPRDVIAFDVSLACSGWGYGLYTAGLLARETGKRVLLLDGDVQSSHLDPNDVNTVSLLADGGTAAIVEKGEGKWSFSFATDGAKGDALKLEESGTIAMDGFGVFRFVATDVVRYVREFLEEVREEDRRSKVKGQTEDVIVADSFMSVSTGRADLRGGRDRARPSLTDLNPGHHNNHLCLTSDLGPLTSSSSSDLRPLTSNLTFVPHQPNVYMVRQLAKSVGFDEAHTALSCDRFGNLSSASIPVTIAANGVRGPVLFAGFGGGLSVSVGRIDVSGTCALSLIEE